MKDGIYKLIGTEVSLFTGKARAYLRYKGIPYEEILSTAQVYKDIIVPRTGVSFIPVLISPDDIVVQDTTDIIDFLETRFPDAPIYPETPLQRLTALLFELYADEWLLIPAMYYRWWFKDDNYDFIVREFGRTSAPDEPEEVRKKRGESIASFFGGTLPALGITKKNHKQIEQWYELFLDYFNQHLESIPFLLGTRPSLGDFGLMGPLYAHLFRDPYPGRLMRSRAPLVAKWVERMNAPGAKSGEFLSDDQVPQTLLPIIKMIFKEHFPVLIDSSEKLAQWLDINPAKKIPRTIGFHEFAISGVVEERAVYPYSQWMFQRPIDFYRTLAASDKEKVDGWLRSIGGYEGMQTTFRYRVRRVRNSLEISK